MFNEMYARDISRKIRTALQVRMEEGYFIGNFAPYGYQKSEADRRRLIPDPVSAEIVRHLFVQAADGGRPSLIADALNRNEVLSPALYRCKMHPKLKPDHNTSHKRWTANTIIKLLHNPVYLGHMVQGKTRKLSFKSGISISVPPDGRTTVLNTHPPLVSEELFNRCQEELKRRACKRR